MSTKWQLKTDGVNFWIEDDFYTICKVSKKDRFEETKTNGLVLSKAPEMLEMLKDIVDELESGETPHIYKIKQLIKEATEL
jgi:hypothetical protein